jgi:hypothetical protein
MIHKLDYYSVTLFSTVDLTGYALHDRLIEMIG